MNDHMTFSSFEKQLRQHLQLLYPQIDLTTLSDSIQQIFTGLQLDTPEELWSEKDSLLITYGDSIRHERQAPLQTLSSFLDRIGQTISMVHILPFCPYSSDDGFAVIDYTQVNSELGSWSDLTAISQKYRLMADLVINHISSQSEWFQNYLKGESPGRGYFIESEPDLDHSQVVRPRSSPLLQEVKTAEGPRHVWCTFSFDQIDLNYQNPEVLLEMFKVIRIYLEAGIRVIRLDAIGFLWKKENHPCIHLEETHEMVRLIRTVIDEYAPGTILITETNVPNQENLTYFGNRNEAHVIYNFSLAPLVIHALLTGESKYLMSWMMSMPPAPVGCTYLNFTASHDGIGMRPAEGLLTEEEQLKVVLAIESFGGRVSRRSMPNGEERIYELNISLFDAMRGTLDGPDEHQIERFLCTQTIMMGLEGLPAFYIHSLLATPNDQSGVERTGQNRAINRHHWELTSLEQLLADHDSPQSIVSQELLRRIQIRTEQPAFNPHATQFTLQLQSNLFGFWRQSLDRQQSVFAIHNLSNQSQVLDMREINLISNEAWGDLLTGQMMQDHQETWTLQPYQCLWITNRI